MLTALLVAPLLGGLLSPPAASSAPVAPPAQNLLSGVPADTFALFHVPNPKATMALRETNDWIGLALDSQWDPILQRLLTSLGDGIDPAEMEVWRQRAIQAMQDSTGLIGFFAGPLDPEAPPENIGLIALGGESCAALLENLVGPDARARTLSTGAEVLISEAGAAELYYEHDGVIMVLSTPTVETSLAVAESCLAGLATGNARGPLAMRQLSALRPSSPAIEFAADLRPIWSAVKANSSELTSFQAKLWEAAASVEWFYGSLVLGLGEEGSWDLVMPYGSSTLLGEALGFFGQADKSLLSRAPKGALSATVGSFDMAGFADWALKLLKTVGPDESKDDKIGIGGGPNGGDLHAQALAGLEAVKLAVGVDLMEDVFGNMTGHFLGFSTMVTAQDSASILNLSGTGPTTLVIGMEETDAILDLADTLIEMSGMAEAFTTETVSLTDGEEEIEVYRMDGSMGLPITVGVGAGQVLVSSDGSGSAAYMQLLRAPNSKDSLLADSQLKGALEGINGALVTIQPTAALADGLESFGEMLDGFAFDEEADANARPGVLMADIAALVRQYLSGSTTTRMGLEGGLIRIESRSR